MRVAWAGLALLLLAGSGAAHFHEALTAAGHTLRFHWAADQVLVEEAFEVRIVGPEPFGGRVYAWLPESGNIAMFGPAGAPPLRNGSGLVGYDLAGQNLSLGPNATLPFTLAWSAPLAPGQVVERRLVYPTRGLEVQAEPPLVLAGAPPGAGGFADVIRVALPAPAGLAGWQVLAGAVVLLAAGAWLWDRRRAGPGPGKP